MIIPLCRLNEWWIVRQFHQKTRMKTLDCDKQVEETHNTVVKQYW